MSLLDGQRLSLYYDKKRRQFDPLQQRLAHEHLLVDRLCSQHDGISYKLLRQEELPPRDYRVTFTGLTSIVGIDLDQLPLFEDLHVLEIHLTPGFPLEPPVCYMCTPTWHPNIQSDPGPFQGRICGNTEGFGAFYSLDELILRIGSMLSFQTYHAEMTDPFPEDEDVARWVREYGEPLGIVAQGRGIVPDWTPSADWRNKVVPEKKLRITMAPAVARTPKG